MKVPFYGHVRQYHNLKTEIDQAILDVLESGQYVLGPTLKRFEGELAEYWGTKHAIGLNSGTDALWLPLLALGIGAGDEVITHPNTFFATAEAAWFTGATVVLVDCDPKTKCIDAAKIEEAVTPKTKAIMPVHLYGNVCDMDKVWALAKKHNLFVIEDNAEAYGGEYKGKKTGTLGNIAGCSFCQNKTFTTGGEGGMVTTDDEEAAWRSRSFRDHGYDVKQRLSLLELEQKLPYIHNMVGWNYRMTEMQSAIGLAELERIENWNFPARRRNAHIIIDALKQMLQVKFFPVDTPERRNGWFVMAFSLDVDNMDCTIQEFVTAAGAEGAPCWKVFWPQCHTERAFQERNSFGRSGFPFRSTEYTTPASADYTHVEVPNALWHEKHTFTCFAYPTYTEENCHEIAAALVKVIKAYSSRKAHA